MTKCSDCKHNNAAAGKEVFVPVRAHQGVTLAEAYALDARFIKVAGAAGTGKTEYLVGKVAALIESKVDPSTICVVVATPSAKDAFRERLYKKCSSAADKVMVTTIMCLCQELLSSAEAFRLQGRVARVLNDAEYKILLEDIKTLGQQPGRIKKMLNYFYFQWSQLEPEEEWLLPREERGVREALDAYLRVRGAMLREELSPLAVAYLEKAQEIHQAPSFSYVLVDDYQSLSKASQTVCDQVCSTALIVTGNENQLIEGFDPYPFKEGFTCFEYHHEGASCVQLTDNLRAPYAVAEMGNALCHYGDQSPERLAFFEGEKERTSLTQIKWTTPEEEFKGIPYVIKSLLDQDESLEEGDVYLVVPHTYWAKILKRNLAHQGIASTLVLDAQPLAGDPRNTKKAAMLISYTKLTLLAHKNDVVAWRSWCGFGDYLCYSGAWSRLEQWVEEQGITVLEGLAALSTCAEEPFLEAKVLQDRYQSGCEMLASFAGKQGFALAKALLAEDDSTGFGALLEPVCGDEDAEAFYERVKDAILSPSFEKTMRKVKIGSYKQLQGLTPRVVVISGFIDGFMPSRKSFDKAFLEEDREREMNICRRVCYNAVTKPSDRLILSTLQKAELEMAETMKMEVRRIRMERGYRLAMLSPSSFIAEAGNAVPGAVSGQQYIGEL